MPTLRLALEYFHPWTNDAGYHVAAAHNWYRDSGLEVRQVLFDPLHGDSLHDLVSGEADLAVCPANRLFVRFEKGDPLIGIAAINHRAMETIQSLRRTGITRPGLLEGRRLALNPTPRGLAMVRHLIERDGGDFSRVEIVDTGTREINVDDLADGVADAFFGAYWAWDGLFGEIPDEDRVTLLVDEIGAPRYHSYLIASRRQFLEEHHEEVAAFLTVTEAGFRYAATEPASTLGVLERTIPYVRSSFLARSLALISPTWFTDGEWGVQRADVHSEYCTWLHENGILLDPQVWTAATTNDFVQVVGT